MSDIVERLNDEARLQAEWDTWELGHGPVPISMDMKKTSDLLSEAAAEIVRLRELTTWRKIDTAYTDGTELLVTGFNYGMSESGRWMAVAKFNGESWHTEEAPLYPPTNWLPLPPPPEDKE